MSCEVGKKLDGEIRVADAFFFLHDIFCCFQYDRIYVF